MYKFDWYRISVDAVLVEYLEDKNVYKTAYKIIGSRPWRNKISMEDIEDFDYIGTTCTIRIEVRK